MQLYTPPKSRRKPTNTDNPGYETTDYNVTDVIKQPDDETPAQEYTYKGTKQAKTLMHKLVKFLKVAHVPLQTNVSHDLKTTQEDMSDHKNKTTKDDNKQ
jgi:hypothetical protein